MRGEWGYNPGMAWMDILRASFEILVLWIVLYQLYRMVKGSRSGAILAGLVVCLLLCTFVLRVAEARVLQEIAGFIIGPSTLLVVLFQPEIRNFLAKMGGNGLLSSFMLAKPRQETGFVEKVVDSVSYLAGHRYGALIGICRTDSLDEYAKARGATQIDAEYSRELIGTIFFPKTLLHDGAVIVKDERVVCAAAILPVSDKELKDRSLGLRHRAAIGLAETSDAVVIVVSEETGSVSLVVGNSMQRNLSMDLLAKRLQNLLYSHANTEEN